MLEPVVADSLHLLVTPLQRYAGRSVSTALLGVHFRCKHVTDLLFSYGTLQGVHVHICVEDELTHLITAMPNYTFGGLTPTRVWGHRSNSMLARWRDCYESVKVHEKSWVDHTWIIRVRPDTAFFNEARHRNTKKHETVQPHTCVNASLAGFWTSLIPQVPKLQGLSDGAVYARARMFGG